MLDSELLLQTITACAAHGAHGRAAKVLVCELTGVCCGD
jgi:hypothetical protein